MAASFNPSDNFIRNFCSKDLDPEDLRLFNVDECRIRKRDVAADMTHRLFHTVVPPSAKDIEKKFNRLWELREATLDRMSEDQKQHCDSNLSQLSQSLFDQKTSLRAKRENCFNSYGFQIRGGNVELLKQKLFEDGKVGIDLYGQIISAEDLTDNDSVLEIVYVPASKDSPDKIIARVPELLHKWKVENSDPGSSWTPPSGLKTNREFYPGRNAFYALNRPEPIGVLEMIMTSGADRSQRPSSSSS